MSNQPDHDRHGEPAQLDGQDHEALISVVGHTITLDGRELASTSGTSPHVTAIQEVARTLAQPAGRPIRTLAIENGRRTLLLVHPDGTAHPAPEAPETGTAADDAASAGRGDTPARAEPPAAGSHRQERPSFITAGRSIQPATRGWRGALNSAGLKLQPGPAEQRERADVAAVARHWPGTRTVAVVNAKGSASKTPTVACLSAVFARIGGAGVLAWDNNETEGTLRFRTEWAGHESTLLNLLPHVDQLLSPTAAVAEMTNFVHHQPADKYDVLWSDTTVDGEHVVSADDVEAIHRVASRYYRMLIMDSGNNSRAENWRAMIEHADAIVVPCTEVEDTAEVGARLLETLTKRGGRSEHLARNALVVVSQRTSAGRNMDRIVAGFEPLARHVVRIPYDAGLETGVIRYDGLDDPTRRAWLRAAAALTEAL